MPKKAKNGRSHNGIPHSFGTSGDSANGTAQPARARIGPNPSLFYTEPSRALMDVMSLPMSLLALNTAPHGDSHPVLVLPGFMAGDQSTFVLRRFLRTRGYRVHGWKQGRNRGPSAEVWDAIGARIHELVDTYDAKISLIGQSLGGIYAREIARTLPEHIRQVITLGTPFANPRRTSNIVHRLFSFMNSGPMRRMTEQRVAQLRQPLPVPFTAIYTKLDGVTHWRSCVEDVSGEDAEARRAENIEVVSSHMGMGFNPAVLYAVADRLAQAEDAWTPFTQNALSGSPFYPTPETSGHLEEAKA